MRIILHILKNTQIYAYKYVFKNTQVHNAEGNRLQSTPDTLLQLFLTAAFCTQTPTDLKIQRQGKQSITVP